MMKCGHAANAVHVLSDGSKVPSCAICVGIVPGADEVDENPPNFEGRMAKCSYRTGQDNKSHAPDKTVPSSSNLAFFSHHPEKPFDEYYCGCWGWD